MLMHLKITRGSNCVDRMAGKNRNGTGWYRSMFENSHQGIILFDSADLTIQECNTAFSSLLHYRPEELCGRSFTSLLSDNEEKERFLTRVGQDQELTGFGARLLTKEGNSCEVYLFGNLMNKMTFCCMAISAGFSGISQKMIGGDHVHYNRFAATLPTNILIVNNGKILYANPAFFVFSGYQQDEIYGSDLLSLFDEPDQTDVKRWLSDTQEAHRKELHLVTKSGNKRLVLLFSLPILYSGKSAVLMNFVDISEKQLLEETIQLDNERRRGIIVTVAHELRTPLQPILGYLNLLIQDPEEFGILDDTKKILERCLASVDRERQIINQMLELSVLDSGKLRLRSSTFSLAELIDNVLHSGGYGAQAEIIIAVPRDLVIAADMDRLFGVIDSLLSNAVNFSNPPRRISIFYQSDINDIVHHISVRDNGTGITKDALSSIFEPFQLADASKLSRRFDRIGLSLSMAKKIMQMHGGDITVESVPGSGSTFTLHLPKSGQYNY